MYYKGTIKSRPVAWIAVLIAVLMIACSDNLQVENVLPPGTSVTAHFRLAALDNGLMTRVEAENMKSWVVIITNQADGAVENVFTKTDLNDIESDFVTSQVTTGTKRIYSFANITLEEIIKAIDPEIETITNPIETIKSIDNIEAAFNAATFLPQGNNWASANNTEGIPMSNWQDIEIKSDGKTYTLYVCRLIAKVEFQLKNLTDTDIKVKGVTISDITSNETPVKLMPGTSVNGEGVKQPRPTFGTGAAPVVVTASADDMTLVANGTTSLTLYVNESRVQSDYGLFRLTLTIDRGTDEEELRYALLSDEASNWTWIARNDHRIIPISIDDYKLDLVPVDFPPIGVYPASVKEDEEGTFTCTFYAGGEFHLTPVVTRYSTGETLPYGWGSSEAGAWEITAFATPETTPAGETNSTTIYTTPLSWNGKDPMLTGTFNNSTTGVTYHELTVMVNKGNDIAAQTLLGRVWVKLGTE